MSERRAFENAFIAAVLAALVASLPSPWAAHARVRKAIGAAFSAIGLCQPEWRLFAPNVPKENARLSAEVVLADGSTRRWASPSFSRKRGVLAKFREGQLPKFYDSLRRDRARATWHPLAERVAREVARGKDVREVRLRRSVERVPPPSTEPYTSRSEAQSQPRAHVFYERRRR